ncbi:hypothetical protein F0919_03610 [Taibaiella lutea]|uniref:Uncharacterized protein n=1 Tax=Taibaiella lutea TaxID=2608001 RepID=A0A5M6CUA7_9BACT|nr:hypothetical protein [Taibaiella lutea]KAA5536769.1 hypothetical protein F0919_03610 [Taibaiella lutea]
MATKSTQTKRMTAKRLTKVEDGLLAASQLVDYAPVRKEYDSEQLENLRNEMQKKHEAEEATRHAYEAARDAAISIEWFASDFLIEVANQAKAQYGANSDEYASLGYKKKAAYKRSANKKK